MASVTLDFGHGGKDPGGVGYGLQEKDLTLNIGLAAGKIVERHNVRVVYTRKTDVFIPLEERANIANSANTDIFVSIHINAFNRSTAQGIEAYSYPTSSAGAILARDIHNELIADNTLYTVNRGLKTANFSVLRRTRMPAVLLELGFITNPQDVQILTSRQDDFALAIAKGILKNLSIKYVPESRPINNEQQPSELARDAWEWAKKEGLLDGTRPHDFVKREELAIVLQKTLRNED